MANKQENGSTSRRTSDSGSVKKMTYSYKSNDIKKQITEDIDNNTPFEQISEKYAVTLKSIKELFKKRQEQGQQQGTSEDTQELQKLEDEDKDDNEEEELSENNETVQDDFNTGTRNIIEDYNTENTIHNIGNFQQVINDIDQLNLRQEKQKTKQSTQDQEAQNVSQENSLIIKNTTEFEPDYVNEYITSRTKESLRNKPVAIKRQVKTDVDGGMLFAVICEKYQITMSSLRSVHGGIKETNKQRSKIFSQKKKEFNEQEFRKELEETYGDDEKLIESLVVKKRRENQRQEKNRLQQKQKQQATLAALSQ